MNVTNRQSGTNVHEIAEQIYRISTPVLIDGAGGFSFNQYLIVDDHPLLFHTGPRRSSWSDPAVECFRPAIEARVCSWPGADAPQSVALAVRRRSWRS
jgi:hypothetical protein